MACSPNNLKQIYNSDRPEYTNTRVVCVAEGETVEVSANNLVFGGDSVIPIFKGSEYTSDFTEPLTYYEGGPPAELTSAQPNIIINEPGCYKFDTSQVDGLEGITITSKTINGDIATMTNGYFAGIPVDVFYYEGSATPVFTMQGTNVRIPNSAIGLDLSDTPPVIIQNEYISLVRYTNDTTTHNDYFVAGGITDLRLRSLTLTVLAGEVTVVTGGLSVVPVTVPAGTKITWSTNSDEAVFVNVPSFTGSADSDYILDFTVVSTLEVSNIGGIT